MVHEMKAAERVMFEQLALTKSKRELMALLDHVQQACCAKIDTDLTHSKIAH